LAAALSSWRRSANSLAVAGSRSSWKPAPITSLKAVTFSVASSASRAARANSAGVRAVSMRRSSASSASAAGEPSGGGAGRVISGRSSSGERNFEAGGGVFMDICGAGWASAGASAANSTAPAAAGM
jgi:hypothetical protein